MLETTDLEALEVLELDDADAERWVELTYELGWSDGMPLVPPTETEVARFVDVCRGDNEPIAAITPRLVVPTLQSLAANAVMAGCKPEYFPVVLAALRAVLQEEYNLHGTLATTHPCTPMLMINGPARGALGINCGTNCFGQGTRANATIGRALGLILSNVGGAKPGKMDRATHGSPAKYSFCFGENEEDSPWAPYHVRRGFAADESVVTVMAAEPPHFINDHGSTSGEGILITAASVMSQSGSNTFLFRKPSVLVFGPEFAATLDRDNWTVDSIREFLGRHARIPEYAVAPDNRAGLASIDRFPIDGFYDLDADGIEIVVAGGAGKFGAWIPSFGGTEVVSTVVKD